MNDETIVTHFENLDRRLTRVEQILPALATKADLTEVIAPLATKAELANLGTELRQEIREEGERSRLHMTGLIEQQDGKIQLLAEHVLSLMPRQPEK